MQRCPTCDEENGDRARFCSNCGAALAAAVSPAGEERKIVSVLFVDLVGFTARSDHADPEDVRATLRVYHDLLKREIERFGGTVEKFIGDAVMAVFGAPVAHEDDAERAVRAALRILEAIEELNETRPELDLAVRGAVNTGEAVVALGARPEAGEGFVTGDVVNVASRLQGAAPVGGVVVGELTHRPTREVIDYEDLPPISVKGKDEPIPIWRAIAARSRFGVDIEPGTSTPLIGRAGELSLLQGSFERVVRDRTPQLVTLSGEPGVGKSRLTREFRTFIDDLPDLVSWRQGRCLPYGEGITFWALAEVVKSHAGILENDGPDEAAAKLAIAVGIVEDEREREWVRARLGSLIGIGDESAVAERDESFAAWRTFLEAIAASRTVRPGDRGSPLGRSVDARVRGAPDRLGERRSALRPMHRPTRTVRTRTILGRRHAQPHGRLVVAAVARRDRAADRRPAGRDRPSGRDAASAHGSRGREPSVRGGVHPDADRPRVS